jgi:Na+/H+ antiporter NhaD/arsenite permease-like protein
MQPLILISFVLAGITAMITAMLCLNWFFRDGDESTEALQAYTDSMSPFSFRPWWTFKFGILIAICLIAAYAVFHWFPILVHRFWPGA